jgi:hypothetical protein
MAATMPQEAMSTAAIDKAQGAAPLLWHNFLTYHQAGSFYPLRRNNPREKRSKRTGLLHDRLLP